MQAPDPIEAALARLMPPALSEDCRFEIESMIDDLAGPEPTSVLGISWIKRCVIGGGIAAAIGALIAIFPMASRQPRVAASSPSELASGLVLVSESDRIESVTDEGWREDSEGLAMHALRLKAVQENNVRDKETGMVVRISEPREEILMMPMVETASLTAAGNGPVRVVNVAEKSASFAADEGVAVVRREEGTIKVKITGAQDLVIFDGEMSHMDQIDKVPVAWQRRIQVLCRTLDQAIEGTMLPLRQPQPRGVPPVSPNP